MTVDEYTSLTGINVPASKADRLQASLDRAQSILESLLGFTLDPEQVTKNLYNEAGKVPSGDYGSSVVNGELLPADLVIGAYRLYPYNQKDRLLSIDPCAAVNAVKLVRGDITRVTFEDDDYHVNYGQSGWVRTIEPVEFRCFFCPYGSGVRQAWLDEQHLQLAVDADWLWQNDIPATLNLIWADIATYYADANRQVKSETVGPHSYSRDITPPEQQPGNVQTLLRYAGPFGSLRRSVTL